MKIPDKFLNSIGDLVDFLRDDIGPYQGPVWYRGQCDASWALQPRLFRDTDATREMDYISRFKQHATLLLDRRPQTEFDWLFLMQHHGIPTRLLDWSENPLTGLYFAAESDVATDAALWVLLPTELNSKSNIRPEFEHEIPSFDDQSLLNYLPTTISRERVSRLNPVAAIASRNSLRMQAQQGVFTISHRDKVSIENVGELGASRDYVWRYIIPAVDKGRLKSDLQRLGMGRFQMFPELSSIFDIIKR